ncbi:phosphoadenosine phosphosulfate reductase family protein [Roseateles sp.]|uniref:phosphoadenosine phosphosulfate reductase domain-containing protein n=1 Tax=Roseateles sp. TaxID=1971397 RepID=UPI0031CF5A97
MSDPFKIDGPTCISFSGGRTSAYMLWRVLQSNGGLPADTVVAFANTGLEAEETLAFVARCATEWAVPIRWIEYRNDAAGFALVDHASASRDGEPFTAIITKRSYLPNPVTRFCTSELKIRPMHRYVRTLGWDEWDQFIGIRADEQRRVSKIRARGHSTESKDETMCMPLADAKVSVQEVNRFWNSQSFNLELATDARGRTTEGNCVYCFNKPPAQRLSIAKAGRYPIAWWVKAEDGSLIPGATGRGARFTKDGPSYADIERYAAEQADMFDPNEEAIPCFCGD